MDKSMAQKLGLDWQGPGGIIDQAREIVLAHIEEWQESMTLRGLYYDLVGRGLLPNRIQQYRYLSKLTAQYRRAGTFPQLVDDRTTRHQMDQGFDSPQDALEHLAENYRTDHTDGQEFSVYIGIEKATLHHRLVRWFSDTGFEVFALGGISTETFAHDIEEAIANDERPSVVLYGGDFDPTGWWIAKALRERFTAAGADFVHVALTEEQVERHGLPEWPGNEKDPRAPQFIEQFGRLVQVEIDALPTAEMQRVYRTALDEWWDFDTYRETLDREQDERAALADLIADL